MKGYVDEQGGMVRVEGQSWPYELDCRSGTVALKLAGDRVRLRRPSWREKRNLARFIHLGEGFLKSQFLRVSLVDESTLPESPAAREALWVLARWYSGPQGQCGLPLDQELLARVTIELCRAMGWSPTVLEDLEADEVEALWRAAGGDRGPAESRAAETRIVVIPDPEPSGTASGDPDDASEHAGMQPITPTDSLHPESSEEAEEKSTPVVATSQNAKKADAPHAVLQNRAGRTKAAARSPQPAGKPSPGALSSAPSRTMPEPEQSNGAPLRTQERFRVVLGSAGSPGFSGNGSGAGSSPRPEDSPSGGRKQEVPAASARAGDVAKKMEAVARIEASFASASSSAAASFALPAVQPSLPASQKMPDLIYVPAKPIAADKSEETERGMNVGAGNELETLLEEFADRLECAAGAMGIDLEP